MDPGTKARGRATAWPPRDLIGGGAYGGGRTPVEAMQIEYEVNDGGGGGGGGGSGRGGGGGGGRGGGGGGSGRGNNKSSRGHAPFDASVIDRLDAVERHNLKQIQELRRAVGGGKALYFYSYSIHNTFSLRALFLVCFTVHHQQKTRKHVHNSNKKN